MARAVRIFVTVAVLFGALVALPTRAETATVDSVMSYTSEAGDWVGGGAAGSFTDADAPLGLGGTGAYLNAFTRTPRGLWFSVTLTATQGQRLSAGEYPDAGRFASGASAGVDISLDGHGCNQVFGSFEIHRVFYDALGAPILLDADLEQRCERVDAPALRVHVFIDDLADQNPPSAVDDAVAVESDRTSAIDDATLLANDGDPDPGDGPASLELATPPAHGALVGTASGFDYTPDPAFDGYDTFTYRAVDGTGRSSAPATVSLAVGTPPQDLLSYTGDTGEGISRGRSETFLHADSTFEIRGTRSNASVVVRGKQEYWTILLWSVSGQDLAPGTYATASGAAGTSDPAADMFGNGRGCAVTGTLVINAIGFDDDGTPNLLDADLEQHCERLDAPALHASIRYHLPAVRPATNVDEYTAPGAIAEPSPGVLTNDSDADPRNELTSLLLSRPQHGSVSLDANGAFAYQANAGYVGDDHFVYRAADPFGLKSVPTIVTVHSTAPPPPDTAYLTLHDSAGVTTRIGGPITRGDLAVENINGWSTVNGAARVDDRRGGKAIIRFVMEPSATAGIVTGTVTIVDPRLGGTKSYRVTETTTRAPNQVSGNAKRIGRKIPYLRFSVTDQRSG